jgi:ABC-type uncharacterized transport system substrate-binding protein
MTKKIVIGLLASFSVVAGSIAHAQQLAKIPRIGYVSANGDPKNPGANVEAFRQGLRQLGYVDGKNIEVEYRYIQGQSARIESLVTELIKLKVDVLVCSAYSAVRVAKQETTTIPILLNIPDDPVAVGLVDSLARPGGNITGLTRLGRELSGKRLELLLEAVPGIKRVGVLWSVTNVRSPGILKRSADYEEPARALKITINSLEMRRPREELEGGFREIVKGGANAVIMINTTPVLPFRDKIAGLAIKNRLPLLAEAAAWADAGALVSYASEDLASFRRLATYVDKVLKGAKSADIPIEQPTKFEFVINLKTAKSLNLTIPQSVLFRADRVIR